MMPRYYVEVENSCEAPLSLAADVIADSEEEAIEKLRRFLATDVGTQLDPHVTMIDLGNDRTDVPICQVYLNAEWLSVKEHVTGREDE